MIRRKINIMHLQETKLVSESSREKENTEYKLYHTKKYKNINKIRIIINGNFKKYP